MKKMILPILMSLVFNSLSVFASPSTYLGPAGIITKPFFYFGHDGVSTLGIIATGHGGISTSVSDHFAKVEIDIAKEDALNYLAGGEMTGHLMEMIQELKEQNESLQSDTIDEMASKIATLP